MKSKENLIELAEKSILNSCFNKQGEWFNVQFDQIANSIQNVSKKLTNNNVINHDNLSLIVPKFQRICSAWTKDMQVKFVENLIKGCKTNITFYSIAEKGENFLENNMILDGQHRMMALLLFINNRLKIFGGLTFKDISNSPVFFRKTSALTFTVLTFDTELEAIQYYIDINENMTHSKKDIERAQRAADELLVTK